MADETTKTKQTLIETMSDTADKKPMRKGLKKVRLVVGVFVAFIVVLVIVAVVATKGATSSSDKFLNALQAGDGQTAYSLFSSEAKKEVPEDEFMAVVNQIGPILNTEEKRTSSSVSGETGSASTAEVDYEIEGTDGKTYVFVVNLVKDNGEWRVLNFDSHTKDK